VAGVLVLLATPLRGADEGRSVVKKGIEAIGGQSKAERLKRARARLTAKVTQGDVRFSITQTMSVELPSRLKSQAKLQFPEGEKQQTQVVDGDHGWLSAEGRVLPLRGPQLAELQESLYTTRVESLYPLLDESAFRLTAEGEIEVAGRPAVGVKVTCPGRTDIQLYFDKQTGLLVKLHRESLDRFTRRDLSQDTYYSDYKSIDGLMRPTRIMIHMNGRKAMDCTVEEWEFVDEFDAKEFAQP
jgi:hypothetical protein